MAAKKTPKLKAKATTTRGKSGGKPARRKATAKSSTRKVALRARPKKRAPKATARLKRRPAPKHRVARKRPAEKRALARRKAQAARAESRKQSAQKRVSARRPTKKAARATKPTKKLTRIAKPTKKLTRIAKPTKKAARAAKPTKKLTRIAKPTKKLTRAATKPASRKKPVVTAAPPPRLNRLKKSATKKAVPPTLKLDRAIRARAIEATKDKKAAKHAAPPPSSREMARKSTLPPTRSAPPSKLAPPLPKKGLEKKGLEKKGLEKKGLEKKGLEKKGAERSSARGSIPPSRKGVSARLGRDQEAKGGARRPVSDAPTEGRKAAAKGRASREGRAPVREPAPRIVSLPLPTIQPIKRPSIEERAASIDTRLNAQAEDFRRRYTDSFDMSWIYHDSALEGVVYTFEELRTALNTPAQPVTDSGLQPTYDDIRRHKEAIEFVRDYGQKKRLPVTLDVVKKIYLILHPEEGDIKTVKYRKDIPQHRLYFHEYAPPDKIAYKVRQIVDWLNDPETRKTRNGVRIAARAHYDLLRVYPFTTDSGKVSRLFMNLLLMRTGLPPAIIHSTERQRYYEALKGSATTVLQMVQEAVENALSSVEKLLDEHETRKRAFVS
jgi:Fic family protein